MKKENKSIILKELIIHRRMYRTHSAETWVIDGISEKDEPLNAVGNLIIFYEGTGVFPEQASAFGAIDYKYEIKFDEEALTEFLREFIMDYMCATSLFINDFMYRGGNIEGASWE